MHVDTDYFFPDPTDEYSARTRAHDVDYTWTGKNEYLLHVGDKFKRPALEQRFTDYVYTKLIFILKSVIGEYKVVKRAHLEQPRPCQIVPYVFVVYRAGKASIRIHLGM